MKKCIVFCLFFISSCVRESDTVKIINHNLLKEVVNFITELEDDPKIKSSDNVTVTIERFPSGTYSIWIVNSPPFNGCQNLIGELSLNKYRVFVVMNSEYSQFIEKIGNYECVIEPWNSDLANYFETFYEYDGKTMKVLGMPSSYP